MPSTYVPDNKSFGEFMLSHQVRQPAVEAAKDIMAIAIATSPYDATRDDREDHFVDHFGVNEESPPVVINKNPRVGAEVYNDSDHAPAVEFGNARVRGHRTLRRAGAKIGELRGEPG